MKTPLELASGALESAYGMFRIDLEALPEEAFGRHFGGKSRTVADIVHEVVLVNDHICLSIEQKPLWEFPKGWITAPEGSRSKGAVLEAVDKSRIQVLQTVQGLTEGDLAREVVTEWGPTDVYERCRFMAWHVTYHSGQLNFIQTLLGDDQWHWN